LIHISLTLYIYSYIGTFTNTPLDTPINTPLNDENDLITSKKMNKFGRQKYLNKDDKNILTLQEIEEASTGGGTI
jgi:hypothetical protein